MHENCAEKQNTAPACRRGAVAFLPVLMFAAAMLLPAPKARAADSYKATQADTNAFCQISPVASNDAFKLPGFFVEGSTAGKARLTGVITGDSPVREFAVDLVVEGRLNPDDLGYSATCRQFFLRCGSSSAGWRVYTALSGTLTGTAGDVIGAVYNVSLGTPPLPPDGATQCDGGQVTNPVAQVGIGANTHNLDLGAFAPLSLVLANPEDFSSLPDPGIPNNIDGEMSINLGELNRDFSFPVPSPNLEGRWEGSIDCVGIADFTDVETFSGPLTLRVGRAGLFFNTFNYDVELTGLPGGVKKNYCAQYAHDLQANSNQGTGLMINGDSLLLPATVFLKVRKNPAPAPATLKARELIETGGGDVNFCTWTFTQTDKGIHTVPFVCP